MFAENFILSRWGMVPSHPLLKGLGKTELIFFHFGGWIVALFLILCTMNSMPHFPAVQPD